jgi:beta-xylosidase
VTFRKPNVGKTYPISDLPVSDEFDGNVLGKQWGWNHNPNAANWSLTQRPGYLRLRTDKPAGSLREARNTLTQRPFTYYSESIPTMATIKMETGKMKDGDIAGLAVFQDPYGYIGVKQTNGRRYVVMVNNGKTMDSVMTEHTTLYFRTIASNSSGKAVFAYSENNKTYTELGDQLSMRFNLSIFTGNKFCLFNYATQSTGGYTDVDWFRVGPLNKKKNNEK